MSKLPLPGEKKCFLVGRKKKKKNRTKKIKTREISEYPGNLTLYVSYFTLGDLETVLHECVCVM